MCIRGLKEIDTRLVYGFLDAGKTTYIKENIRDDRFYKYGSTLIICFEKGEEKYDAEALAEKRARVVYYDRESEITCFCKECIEAYQPDRIYVEMNTMMPELREQFPDCMRVTFSIALIRWATMPVYYLNFMQMMKQMVSESNQVTFRGCPSGELLAPYAQAFRLMNPKAMYLRQDPMGYHEKAFGLFLPFPLDESEIRIDEKSYLPLWLDALDHPEHYDGKVIHFTDPVELRKSEADGLWRCGRVVMTCCMADLQFMSFEMADLSSGDADDPRPESNIWVTIDASARAVSDSYGQRKLLLVPDVLCRTDPPGDMILDGRKGQADI